MDLLAAVAAKQPVTLLVDDVQWLDQQSQEVLTFIVCRAGPHPMVIIGAMRTGHPGSFLAAGLPQLVVQGVDESAADDILRVKAGVLKPTDRLRIRQEAQGNPLALLELPTAWAGSTPPPADWQPTLSARLERAFAGRFAELPPVTRDGVLIAAVDPGNEMDEILAGGRRLTSLLACVQLARGIALITDGRYRSPRTVGSHLYRIFPKLEITSRAQLAARLGQA